MTTSTPISFADVIVPGARISLNYAMGLASDIPAERWGESVIANCNHPAFNYAHLAIYPNRIFGMLDRDDLCLELPFDPELVMPGVECRTDASCYPGKDEAVALVQDGYNRIIDHMLTLDAEVFAADNTMGGRMTEMFPTMGAMFGFMLNNHVMMHMGQVSAWRRAIGLGSAM